MPRKKKVSASSLRMKDKLRKREQRLKKSSSVVAPHDDQLSDSSVPCGSEVGAVTASPSNVLGQVSVGFPLKEEKPLARVRASLREKMHPPAPRLPSPRGSRLNARNEGKAPSSDSPPWVCAPPRAPGPDPVHGSGPAGQAQLEGSKEECTSRTLKDEDLLTENKQYSESITNSILNEQNVLETIYENDEKNEISENLYDTNDDMNEISENLYGTNDEMNEISENLYDTNDEMNDISENLYGTNDEMFEISENLYDTNDEMSENLYDTNDEMFEISENLYDTNDEMSENLYDTNDEEEKAKSGIGDRSTQIAPNRGNVYVCKSVQGSFHQADILFQDNAGTQCVANCLAALSYHKLKSANYWTTMDMNRILMTGDELYTFLQRCSSINDRYLLVEELPENFECYNRLYQFHANDSLASVILANEGLDYAEFNALPLDEALQIALTDTDGCFVCFGGNSLLIGKTEDGFFAFDSHSRSLDGMCSFSGKSTRVLLQNVIEVFSHLENLAISLGYSESVECNFTGVCCKNSSISYVGDLHEEDWVDICSFSENGQSFMNVESEANEGNDDLIIISQQQIQYKFTPLSATLRTRLCQNLNIPYMGENDDDFQRSVEYLGNPKSEITIESDGNCFFRAISFSIANNENFHDIFRTAVCEHLRKNKELFKPFLRNGMQSIDNYLSSSCMSKDGTWATEVEIFAMAHLLEVDIYTFSTGNWLRFGVEDVESCRLSETGSIYLNHSMENHYNVVVAVCGEDSNLESVRQKSQKEIPNDYKKRFVNRQRMQAKQRSIKKYATDSGHREDVKLRSVKKYHTIESHKADIKKRSIQRYAEDEEHREKNKRKSIQKYAEDEQHKENVRKRSIEKYKSDQLHKMRVSAATTQRYKENKIFRERKLKAAAEKYRSNETLRSKSRTLSKKRYATNSEVRSVKKEKVYKQRIAQKIKLKNEEEVVKMFKEKAVQGPDYSCCCCDRLLFENQVQKCEQTMYASNIQAANVAEMCVQEKYSHTCLNSCPKNCIKSKLWICFTCHRKILRGDVPAESAFNKMGVDDIPKELQELNSLEKHLIAMHIPFMKVMALPHGGQQNIHGPVVCVPSNLKKVTRLPVRHGDDLLLRVKLKRKLNYKGYFEYQFVDPKHIFEALHFLKENNEWYKEVTINSQWEDKVNDSEGNLENDVNVNDDDQLQVATDTCLQPVDIAQEVLDHYFDDVYNIAPGEGNNPVRMLQETGNEAKAFPHLFPKGRFSWSDVRDKRITLSRYFNNRLMNTDDRFAKDSSYIFFSQFMSDLNQVIEKTQISIRKSNIDGMMLLQRFSGNKMTAGTLVH
ncbi:uncharacterized protein LOC144619975 [Crassostrea virginica]